MDAHRTHKPQKQLYSQKERREEALKQVRDRSRKQISATRELNSVNQVHYFPCFLVLFLLQTPNDDDLAAIFQQGLSISDNQRNKYPRETTLLMQHQWMTDYPADLTEHWLVMPRPEGRRCLVESSRGATTSFLKNGGILHKFKSNLPGGHANSNGSSVLDCIFHEDDDTYYIMDLISWNGVLVTDCESFFRLHWIRLKLMECQSALDFQFKSGNCTLLYLTFTRFSDVPFEACDHQGLLKSLYDYVPFVRDGIVVLHREGHYIHGPNELALVWKDLTCSRYLVDTDKDGFPLKIQSVVLRLDDDGSLITGDAPPVQFSHTSQCQIRCPEKLKAGQLLKMDLHEDRLELISFIRNRKRNPDLISKILFQKQAREGKVSSASLLAHVK